MRLLCYMFCALYVQTLSYHFNLIGVYLYRSITHLLILCFHCHAIKNKSERR